MLDIAWSEMAIILIVALIVIGPKDLPKLAREIGRWTSKARGMAREFQRSLDDMAREADLQDLKQGLDKVTSRSGLTDTIRQTIDPDRSLEKAMDVDMGLPTGSVMSSPPTPPIPAATDPAVAAVSDAGTTVASAPAIVADPLPPPPAAPAELQPVAKS